MYVAMAPAIFGILIIRDRSGPDRLIAFGFFGPNPSLRIGFGPSPSQTYHYSLVHSQLNFNLFMLLLELEANWLN